MSKANRKSIRAPVAPIAQIQGLYTCIDTGNQGPFLLWDVSESGLGLWVGQQLQTAERLRLTMSTPYPLIIEAIVCWAVPSPDGKGFRCGIEIAAEQQKLSQLYQKFREIMEDAAQSAST